jgi:hypothetical protein
VTRTVPLRDAIVGRAVALPTALGALRLGVLDPAFPGVAEAVAGLLARSIADAREEAGGHLPSWLVEDIRRNYISPERVQTLWAATGHRFGVLRGDELHGCLRVARIAIDDSINA